MTKNNKIITRVAPSPTGQLHIGSARTALFNYLFAKKNNGKYIIRIEDTDIERSKPEFEKDIFDGLEWLGISSGPNEKFNQSKRFAIYQKYLDKLIERGSAYKCFCSQEELDQNREEKKREGSPPIYSGKCFNLRREKETDNFVIRLRVNTEEKEIVFNDLIRGKIKINKDLIGDFVIAKVKENKIFPLYNFVVVVDDYEMGISHIIRGEDHIPNTPKQILIQKALDFNTPQYAHLPLILAPDKSKMSKRSGATSLISYKEDGYLPEALINFMAFLGWNPKDEREFFTIEELIKEFSIENIQKSGAVFNIEKLDHINSYYIRKKKISELTALCQPYLIKTGLISDKKKVDSTYLEKIISIHQERLKKLSEISEMTEYFFKSSLDYQKEMFAWKATDKENTIKSLEFTKDLIYDKIREEEFNEENIKKIFFAAIPQFNKSIGLSDKDLNDKGYILWPFRVALTAKKASSGPFEIAEILGKKEVLKRVNAAINFLSN